MRLLSRRKDKDKHRCETCVKCFIFSRIEEKILSDFPPSNLQTSHFISPRRLQLETAKERGKINYDRLKDY